MTRENGDRFRRTLLSRGGSEDPLQQFKNFTGGEPDIAPLLERRGLNGEKKPASAAEDIPPEKPKL
jgi:peptidyl-dipeptidase Dcp